MPPASNPSAPWTLLGVPIDSVGRAGGTELAPAAFREQGLAAAIGAGDAGDLDVRVRGDERDAVTGLVGSTDVLAMTPVIRAGVREILDAGGRPLVLGGCCALLPGALAAVRDVHGRSGLAYLDGHVDVYDGLSSPTGEAADMPVGVALGRAPQAWATAAGGPSLEPRDVAVLGARDPEEAADIAGLLATELSDIEVIGPDDLRAEGLAAGAARVAARLGRSPGRFWLGLDVDVLSQEAMPATDYLMPGGLDWDDLAAVLGPLAASPALIGVSIQCVNPEKDPGAALTHRTVETLAAALASG